MYNFIDEIKPLGAECENYVLYFGRYSEEKGISNLVKAAKKLSNIPFVFAGKGELENEVNSADNIKNVGFKTGDELRNIIEKRCLPYFLPNGRKIVLFLLWSRRVL